MNVSWFIISNNIDYNRMDLQTSGIIDSQPPRKIYRGGAASILNNGKRFTSSSSGLNRKINSVVACKHVVTLTTVSLS